MGQQIHLRVEQLSIQSLLRTPNLSRSLLACGWQTRRAGIRRAELIPGPDFGNPDLAFALPTDAGGGVHQPTTYHARLMSIEGDRQMAPPGCLSGWRPRRVRGPEVLLTAA